MSWDLRPHLQSHVSVGEVNDGSHETTRAASWGGGDSTRGELSPCHPPKERRALRAKPRSGGSARRLGAPSTSFPLLPGLRTHRTQAGWLPDDKWQCHHTFQMFACCLRAQLASGIVPRHSRTQARRLLRTNRAPSARAGGEMNWHKRPELSSQENCY